MKSGRPFLHSLCCSFVCREREGGKGREGRKGRSEGWFSERGESDGRLEEGAGGGGGGGGGVSGETGTSTGHSDAGVRR